MVRLPETVADSKMPALGLTDVQVQSATLALPYPIPIQYVSLRYYSYQSERRDRSG